MHIYIFIYAVLCTPDPFHNDKEANQKLAITWRQMILRA